MEKRYEVLTDEELIEKLRAGESGVMDFLLEKYKYLVRKKANAVFLLGGDTDDLVQEGMIGLFKAVRDFDSSQGSFYYFADLCIGRQIYHAIEAASRKKHGPLNSYISLSGGIVGYDRCSTGRKPFPAGRQSRADSDRTGECGTVSGGNSFQLKPVRAESINGLSGWHELPPDCRKMEQAGEIH